MTGTIINIVAVLIGGALGLLFGARLPERLKGAIVISLGLFTAAFGMKMFFETENELIVLGALLIGVLLGEWWKIEDGLQHLGQVLEARFAPDPETASQPQTASTGNFVRGFLTASLIFCIGPLAILGAIQDGLEGNYTMLAVKSILDGFAAMAFASSFGVGVLFSTLVILFFQGGISLITAQLASLLTLQISPEMVKEFITPYVNELTATGGVILIGLAISNLLEIKKIRTGNFLPALVIAPLIVWILKLLGQ
ncbi:MAG: DUF554 domain-containing protein [Anaerolineales bacterium]|nr:DUF554 domain-containing protein [Anaerolineales bacterium]